MWARADLHHGGVPQPQQLLLLTPQSISPAISHPPSLTFAPGGSTCDMDGVQRTTAALLGKSSLLPFSALQ